MASAISDIRAGDRLARLWRRSSSFVVGSALVALLVLTALLCGVVSPYGPTEVLPNAILQAPSAAHWFGTDGNGMDVFTRVLYGARYAIAIALPSALVMVAVGVPLGLIAGYYGGVIDEVLTRMLDVLRAFPSIILALAVVSATGQSLVNVVVVIGLIDAPIFARMVRSEVISIRRSDFVASAVVTGNPTWRILFVHLLPNTIKGAAALLPLRMAWALRVSATLAFVGVGIQAPEPEWGALIRQGAEYIISGQHWVAMFPGIALVIAVFGFNLMGDGLQELTDPRLDVKK
ncbi:ABC transporter permease [Aquibium sp. ELW1220]|uniref:ABC transporter permease n=1 Tax=Aquibium sp. ELW1220 TaxID=2976766 RepID=UPI0025AF61FD|nr:ABC transporter permease [Aquibium sp. ELW1220]MDN2580491.1 ABC transporter permease [Aquibium sp. ELW1220]